VARVEAIAPLADYNSMIDDLLALTPKPQLFLALPPPAFANSYDIDGTVIANQIIPIIEGIAADRQLPVIDVHGALAGMSNFFPDGVHPNDMGHTLIATTMLSGLRSPTIPPTDGEGCASPGTECDYAEGCLDPETGNVLCHDGAWEVGTPYTCIGK
jgi:hypothetical protein